MGLRNRQTREALAKLDEEEFAAFLDDVSDMGLTKACEARVWTVGATLNWIRDDEGRLAWYEGALRTKSEALAHETLEIADASDEPKLRIDTRFKIAGKWDRARYGETVKVEHAGTVKVDAGLVMAMGELLERAVNGRVIEHEHEKTEAVEIAGVSSPEDRASTAGLLRLNESPRQSVIVPVDI